MRHYTNILLLAPGVISICQYNIGIRVVFRLNLLGGVMKAGKLIRIGILLLVVPALSGCWLLAVGGAGAYGGYKMKEKGYTVQNPVKKEAPDTTEK